jgi:tRNA threonylcarbamoyladenosine biosynthesis protein TsaE
MGPAVDMADTVWRCSSGSEGDTVNLGRLLGACLFGGETIALIGDLGAGKTRFVQGLAEGLGVAPSRISSPTFAIRHDHLGRLPLLHLDFYRLRDPDEIEWLGMLEASSDAVLAIEWADRLPDVLPPDRLDIVFETTTSPADRIISWTARGEHAERALAALRAAYGG